MIQTDIGLAVVFVQESPSLQKNKNLKNYEILVANK